MRPFLADRPRATFRLMVAAALVAFSAMASAPASVGAETAKRTVDADLLLTAQARQLLFEDSKLSDLNLGVVIRGRVAVLWGPVPSEELAQRAIDRVKTLFEVIDVRNQMVVSPERFPERFPQRPLFLPDQPPKPFPPVAPSGVLTTRAPEEKRSEPQAAELLWRPAAGIQLPGKPAPAETLPSLPSSIWVPLANPEAKTTVSLKQSQLLERTVRELVQSDPRFGAIQVEVRGHDVHLRASRTKMPILHELSRAVSRVPGVEGVHLGAD
jgi:hypothetical protein